jgi:hypothetical protein
MKLFVDGCIIYRKITNKNDIEKLQKGLDTLGEWEVENGIKINPGKSKGMRVTRARVKKKKHWFTFLVTKKFRKRAVVNNLTKRFKLDGPSELHGAKCLEGTSL